jgi:2-polyprenyl-3-methyl-5-hydroxy-6-metoxy-1,4-benzoquinol methylase
VEKNGLIKEAMKPPGYRQRIYGEYVSAFKRTDRASLIEEAQRHARFFDHLFRSLLEANKSMDIVEAGCGPGHFLYWAESRGFQSVSGFDLSNEQVELARSLGLRAEEASFQSFLPRARESYDWIVALDLVEHLTRDEGLEFLDLCREALRPGGRIFLTTPNGAGLRSGPVSTGDLTHETIYSPQTIALALRLTGYEAIEVREIIPPPTSLRSRVRRMLWKAIRLGPMIIDLVEAGSSGGIYSRVMSVSARKPL